MESTSTYTVIGVCIPAVGGNTVKAGVTVHSWTKTGVWKVHSRYHTARLVLFAALLCTIGGIVQRRGVATSGGEEKQNNNDQSHMMHYASLTVGLSRGVA